jgi:tetratricopeptide (TPR) repeat protein
MATIGERYDFFLSRRGSVAAIAREVTDVLVEKGYKVIVQDYDIPLSASFIDAMHEAVKNSRDLIILFTRDYEQSRYTRKEFTSFEAERAQSAEERHIIVLRCEDVPLRGLLADTVYQDLVGIEDQEERKRRIVAAAERQSQSAPPPPRPSIGVPPRIAGFTGRVTELDRLDGILMRDKPAAVTQSVHRAAVQGMGGIGKTSLAIEYAHRYRNLYGGVCWCPAETRASLLSALAGLAVAVGAAGADEPDVQKAAKAGLRRLAEQRSTWLLVYDNVSSPEEIADLLPSAGARLLITSRFPDWSSWAEEITLDVLPPDEAVRFLQSRTGRDDRRGAQTLADALGNLPLALEHAAAYCRRTQLSFIDYAARASSFIASVPRGSGYPRSVVATFDLAISEAVTQCGFAGGLMACLAQCAPERIPMSLVRGASGDEIEHLQALTALVEVSLVKHDPFEDGTPAVTVHRLVQYVARARAAAVGQRGVAIERLVRALAVVCPLDAYGNPNSWLQCARLAAHVLTARTLGADDISNKDNASWPTLLIAVASYFQARGIYTEAERLFRQALAINERTLGVEHFDTASSMNDLANLLRDEGKLSEARELFERALAIKEKILEPEHPSIATSLNNLGHLLHDERKLPASRSLLERALAIREKALGSDDRLTAQTLNNLAGVLADQDDTASARELYQRALDIYRKAVPSDHPDMSMILGNLGAILYQEGDLLGARPLFEQALAIDEKTYGSEHPATAHSLNSLARVLRDAKDYPMIESLYRRAIQIADNTLGADHTLTQVYRRNFAGHLVAAGRPGEALQLAQNALAIHEQAFGESDGWTKGSAQVTADALDALGRTDEASALRGRYGPFAG